MLIFFYRSNHHLASTKHNFILSKQFIVSSVFFKYIFFNSAFFFCKNVFAFFCIVDCNKSSQTWQSDRCVVGRVKNWKMIDLKKLKSVFFRLQNSNADVKHDFFTNKNTFFKFLHHLCWNSRSRFKQLFLDDNKRKPSPLFMARFHD